jgi:hypothetical protein
VTTPPVVSDLSDSSAPSDRHLEQLRRFAWLLDSQFRVPGTNFRFGLDAVVGLIPGIGDFAGAIASTVFLAQALRMGAPRVVLGRMVANILVETLVGAIPGLGDLFDATFKANRRNMRLLERLTESPELTHRASRRYLIGIAIAIAAALLVIGILAVIIGVMVVRAITEGRGPLG